MITHPSSATWLTTSLSRRAIEWGILVNAGGQGVMLCYGLVLVFQSLALANRLGLHGDQLIAQARAIGVSAVPPAFAISAISGFTSGYVAGRLAARATLKNALAAGLILWVVLAAIGVFFEVAFFLLYGHSYRQDLVAPGTAQPSWYLILEFLRYIFGPLAGGYVARVSKTNI